MIIILLKGSRSRVLSICHPFFQSFIIIIKFSIYPSFHPHTHPYTCKFLLSNHHMWGLMVNSGSTVVIKTVMGLSSHGASSIVNSTA